jgi:hypothetical protein
MATGAMPSASHDVAAERMRNASLEVVGLAPPGTTRTGRV